MPHGSGNAFKQTLSRKKARDAKQRRLTEMNTGFNDPSVKTEYDFPELSPAALEKVKLDIRKKLKTENRIRSLTLIALTTITLVALVYYFFYSE